MPVYNGGASFALSIESILAQTYRDLELIISDNASTDRSIEIAERYAAADTRVHLLRSEENIGGNPNYRKVAQAARGQYFKWASCNDLIDPQFIGACVDVLDSDPGTVLCHGQTMIFADDPAVAQRYDADVPLESNDAVDRFIKLCSRLRLNNVLNGVIRRDALMRTSIMADYIGADNVVVAELALLGKFRLIDNVKFFRKLSESGATAFQSPHKILAHHYPHGGIRSKFQTWQHMRGYLRAVTRTPLKTPQRVRAVGYVMRSIYWSAPDLIGDLVSPTRSRRASRQQPERDAS
jgi:glycosyltransferase involved in cell wall biosynthesis